MSGRKKIAVLGSTGSIGVNCLNVVRNLHDEFEIVALSSFKNADLLFEQASEFKPQIVALAGREMNDAEKERFQGLGIETFSGPGCLAQVIGNSEFDLLVNSVVGAAGFLPTLRALEAKKDIALANKETLVVGGEIITEIARKNGCLIYPIDSEHSAIFQCLVGEDYGSIENIILTASGGPFRKFPESEFKNITVEQALKHPNWDMGAKITIDSATMMNKGLEVIEAHWLFGIEYDRIQVVIHPQSIIHSMVSFVDGSIKAQMGQPDMRVPIQYAMTYPVRQQSNFPRVDFSTLKQLDFEKPDMKKFRALALAFQAGKTGGTAPAIMNAANEAAVNLFLQKKIGFVDITNSIEKALNKIEISFSPTPEELVEADKLARESVASLF